MQLVSADDQQAAKRVRYQKLIDNLGAPLGLDFSGSRGKQALEIIEAWDTPEPVLIQSVVNLAPIELAVPVVEPEVAPVDDGPKPVGD